MWSRFPGRSTVHRGGPAVLRVQHRGADGQVHPTGEQGSLPATVLRRVCGPRAVPVAPGEEPDVPEKHHGEKGQPRLPGSSEPRSESRRLSGNRDEVG